MSVPVGDGREGLGRPKWLDDARSITAKLGLVRVSEVDAGELVAYVIGLERVVGQLTQDKERPSELREVVALRDEREGRRPENPSYSEWRAYAHKLEARVGQLTQERDNAWAAAEQDQLWRESLLRRITELEAVKEAAKAVCRYHDGTPGQIQKVQKLREALSTSKEDA